MGIGSTVKKLGKQAVKSLVSPYNFVVAGAGGAADVLHQDHSRRQEDRAERNRIAEQERADNEAFEKNLEKRRKSNVYSKVVYAGVLGDGANVGLGGKKSLLGL